MADESLVNTREPTVSQYRVKSEWSVTVKMDDLVIYWNLIEFSAIRRGLGLNQAIISF